MEKYPLPSSMPDSDIFLKQDATTLLEKVQECDPAYFIEGRRVTAGFARNTPNPQLSKAKPALVLIIISFWSELQTR